MMRLEKALPLASCLTGVPGFIDAATRLAAPTSSNAHLTYRRSGKQDSSMELGREPGNLVLMRIGNDVAHHVREVGTPSNMGLTWRTSRCRHLDGKSGRLTSRNNQSKKSRNALTSGRKIQGIVDAELLPKSDPGFGAISLRNHSLLAPSDRKPSGDDRVTESARHKKLLDHSRASLAPT